MSLGCLMGMNAKGYLYLDHIQQILSYSETACPETGFLSCTPRETYNFMLFELILKTQKPSSPTHRLVNGYINTRDDWSLCLHLCLASTYQGAWPILYVVTVHVSYSSEVVSIHCDLFFLHLFNLPLAKIRNPG